MYICKTRAGDICRYVCAVTAKYGGKLVRKWPWPETVVVDGRATLLWLSAFINPHTNKNSKISHPWRFYKDAAIQSLLRTDLRFPVLPVPVCWTLAAA